MLNLLRGLGEEATIGGITATISIHTPLEQMGTQRSSAKAGEVPRSRLFGLMHHYLTCSRFHLGRCLGAR